MPVENIRDEIIFILECAVCFRYLPEQAVVIDIEIEAFRQILERIAHPVSAAEILLLGFGFPDGFVVPRELIEWQWRIVDGENHFAEFREILIFSERWSLDISQISDVPHFVRGKLGEFFLGFDWSEIEDDGVSCRVSSSVAVLLVDLYSDNYFFYLFFFIAILIDELHDLADDLGIAVFFRVGEYPIELYLVAYIYAFT